MAVFGEKAVPTGLKHGTVTVCWPEGKVETTTFRRDGAYVDHRHPEQVTFTDSLTEDLARRDFTVNAVALDRGGRYMIPLVVRRICERGSCAAWGTRSGGFRRMPFESCGVCGLRPGWDLPLIRRRLRRWWSAGNCCGRSPRSGSMRN